MKAKDMASCMPWNFCELALHKFFAGWADDFLGGSLDSISRAELVLWNPRGVHSVYDVENEELGEGGFGTVCRGRHKQTGMLRAIKFVPMQEGNKQPSPHQEIAMLTALDHPHIIKLYETFEDAKQMSLAMEFCGGGELFDRLVAGDFLFAEDQAVVVMQQLLSAVFYLHDSHIAHRDLKPENILFSSTALIAENSLKVIDFGLAAFCPPGKMLHNTVGTPSYMAPQVVDGCYDTRCDVWSAGVIMYVLLSGREPIRADNSFALLTKVQKGRWNFRGRCWRDVSQEAKNLVRGLLARDPARRLSAREALQHKWLARAVPQNDGLGLAERSVASRLCKLRLRNRLETAALKIVARRLQEDQVHDLRSAFEALDADGNGRLSPEELHRGLELAGFGGLDTKRVLSTVDTDHNGVIEYSEFVAATFDRESLLTDEVLQEAFGVFDRDGDGKISLCELQQSLCGDRATYRDRKDIGLLLAELDARGHGGVDFKEFAAMMREGAGLWSSSGSDSSSCALIAADAGGDVP